MSGKRDKGGKKGTAPVEELNREREREFAKGPSPGEKCFSIPVPYRWMSRLMAMNVQLAKEGILLQGIIGGIHFLVENGLREREGVPEARRPAPSSGVAVVARATNAPPEYTTLKWSVAEDCRGSFSVCYDTSMYMCWLEVYPESAGDPVQSCEDLKTAVGTASALLDDLSGEEILFYVKTRGTLARQRVWEELEAEENMEVLELKEELRTLQEENKRLRSALLEYLPPSRGTEN